VIGLARSAVSQQVQHVPDGAFAAVRFGQRHMRLYFVAVASSVLGLDDITSCGEVGNKGTRPSFCDGQARRDVAEARVRISCDAQQGPAMVREKAPTRHDGSLVTKLSTLPRLFQKKIACFS
jgi:hypothetical protein